jgi:Zn-dependent peptidase ImmA (M78 family)
MKRATTKLIKDKVSRLLREMRITSAPIDVDRIAQHVGIPIRREFLNGDISGFLYRKDERAAIVVNRRQFPTRQRFTIAHELGHYFLDHKRDEIHVDRAFVLKFRNGSTPAGSDPEEIHANAFAAELLMPENFLQADLVAYERHGVIDDTAIQILADKYEVSIQALIIRLNTIGLAPTVSPT